MSEGPFPLRRSFLARSAAVAVATAAANTVLSDAVAGADAEYNDFPSVNSTTSSIGSSAKHSAPSQMLRYCLNTSTIRGQKLPINKQIEVVAAAGYDGIEIWLGDVDQYVKSGGNLIDLRKQIADSGLQVESAIAFPNWIVDDAEKRTAGFEQAKRDMDTLRFLGGRFIAAPPAGATAQPLINLDDIAVRFAELIEIGRARDVSPQLEVWGFSANLHKLCDVMYVATACAKPDVYILPDVYHLYKGGNDFASLVMLPGSRVHAFHMNDYPADPSLNVIADKDRVYPGDGIAPIDFVLQTMWGNGFRGVLSLELFNESYWKQDALEVAKTGLEKMKAAASKALD